MTGRKLAAGFTVVFVTALLSAGLAYALGGLLLAWWLLIDLGRCEAGLLHITGHHACMGDGSQVSKDANQ